MHLKKVLGIALTVAASSLLLAACGNSSSSSKDSGKETLTFWYGGDADTAVKPIINKFTKQTGVKVKIQSIPWSQYNDKLLTAAASKTGPDVMVMGTTSMPNYVSSKTLMDITSTVKKDSALDPSKFFSGSEETTKFNGKYYAVPWYTETRVLYYRKDLLKQVGYNSAPKTWDQLYDAALKLSKRGKNMYGFNVDGADAAFGFMFARQNGSKLLVDNKPEFNKKPMVETVEYLNKFIQNGASPKQDTKMSIGQSFGGDGPVPMFISGPWMMAGIKSDAGLKDSQWGVATLPAGKNGNVSNMGGGDLAIFNYSKNKSNAMKLLKFMSKKENQLTYYKNSDSMPTLKSAWSDKSLSDEKIQVFRKQLDNSKPMPLIKQWDQIGVNYLKYWEQVSLNKADPQKTMDSFNKQTEELLNK